MPVETISNYQRHAIEPGEKSVSGEMLFLNMLELAETSTEIESDTTTARGNLAPLHVRISESPQRGSAR